MHPVPLHLRRTCWLAFWMLQSVDPAGDSSFALCFTTCPMRAHVRTSPRSESAFKYKIKAISRRVTTQVFFPRNFMPARSWALVGLTTGSYARSGSRLQDSALPPSSTRSSGGASAVFVGEAVDHMQPSAVTACCTAIDSMPRHVRAHPDIAARRTAGGALQARARTRSRTRCKEPPFQRLPTWPQHDEALQTCGSELRVGDPITSLRNSKRCPVDVRTAWLRLPCAGVAPQKHV